ncbi:MAG TPA: hypothetical protein VN666_21855 [Nitrospira sp.]|nr:hypothetical protein [Nitrospira sp.]
MITKTVTIAQHTTNVTSEHKCNDGGRELLLELFDDLHSDKRVGTMRAQFGPGGSISHLEFVETERIKQSEIEVEEKLPEKRYL